MSESNEFRELLLAALSVSDGGNVERWERHLVNAFGAFLGGEDVFESGGMQCTDKYLLFTVAELDRMEFSVYQCADIALLQVERTMRRYGLVGQGLFVRCLLGSHVELREEIGQAYRHARSVLGAKDFATMVGKRARHSDGVQPGLVDISRGVLDHVASEGTADNRLRMFVTSGSRIHGGQYQDIRCYADREALLNGLFGAWTKLVSSSERDWEIFSSIVSDAFR